MIYFTGDTKYISYLEPLSAARQWPKEQVVSDFNFFAFLRFVNKQNLDTQMRLLKLPVLQHSPESEPVQIKLENGKIHTTSVVMCKQDDCDRCVQGRGGYRFHFVGPWTCKNTFGLTPAESRYTWMNCRECFMCNSR